MPPGPAGSSISISTGPLPDFLTLLAEDPFYKQSVQNLTDARDTTLTRTGEAETRDINLFNLDKELSERTNRQRERYLREFAASRGMVDSGQLGADQMERMFQFTNMQSQQQTQQDADIAGFANTRTDANLAWARGKGEAAMSTYERMRAEGKLLAPSKMALWDEESQLYLTQDGEYYDAYGVKTNYTKPGTTPPPGTPPPGEPPPSEPGDPDPWDPYPPSRPPVNPPPGGGVRNPEWPPAAPPVAAPPPPPYYPPPPPPPPVYPPSRPPENPVGPPWGYE